MLLRVTSKDRVLKNASYSAENHMHHYIKTILFLLDQVVQHECLELLLEAGPVLGLEEPDLGHAPEPLGQRGGLLHRRGDPEPHLRGHGVLEVVPAGLGDVHLEDVGAEHDPHREGQDHEQVAHQGEAADLGGQHEEEGRKAAEQRHEGDDDALEQVLVAALCREDGHALAAHAIQRRRLDHAEDGATHAHSEANLKQLKKTIHKSDFNAQNV